MSSTTTPSALIGDRRTDNIVNDMLGCVHDSGVIGSIDENAKIYTKKDYDDYKKEFDTKFREGLAEACEKYKKETDIMYSKSSEKYRKDVDAKSEEKYNKYKKSLEDKYNKEIRDKYQETDDNYKNYKIAVDTHITKINNMHKEEMNKLKDIIENNQKQINKFAEQAYITHTKNTIEYFQKSHQTIKDDTDKMLKKRKLV